MNFLDIKPMTRKTDPVQLAGHHDDIDHLPRVPAIAPQTRRVQDLRAAAKLFALRSPKDSFAIGKEATCLDLANKLERFGSFVSDKQDDFARKLVEWSLPRGQQGAQAAPGAPAAAPVAPTPAPAPVVRLERLFDLMQRLSKLTIGEITIARKNQDSLCWVKVAGRDGVVGKIENGTLSLFWGRLHTAKIDAKLVEADLLRIEADPEAAAVLHGKASGRCAICSRDLTDPVSIERGIGPICAERF